MHPSFLLSSLLHLGSFPLTAPLSTSRAQGAARKRLEDALGTRLPEETALFFGLSCPLALAAFFPSPPCDVILGYAPGNAAFDLEATVLRLGKQLPKRALPFARDPYGNYFLLDLPTSKVAFWEHESGVVSQGKRTTV